MPFALRLEPDPDMSGQMAFVNRLYISLDRYVLFHYIQSRSIQRNESEWR